MISNKIASVWYIEDNELKHSNKIISTVNYNNMEIPILKSEKNDYVQDFLIKDKNNEYWKLGIAPIKFNLFLIATEEKQETEATKYCNDITNAYKNIDLELFWGKKINNKQYFNKCELEYIYRYYPDMYEKAKVSRETFISIREQEKKEHNSQVQKRQKELVETVNDNFQKKLKEIKYKIFIGERVEIENLEFYKDDKYENGKTIQNSILYLAKQYEIQIPLATQGFINNRLVNYNFKTREFSYKVTTNRRASVKFHEYLEQIFEKVKEEFKHELEIKKKKAMGAR